MKRRGIQERGLAGKGGIRAGEKSSGPWFADGSISAGARVNGRSTVLSVFLFWVYVCGRLQGDVIVMQGLADGYLPRYANCKV